VTRADKLEILNMIYAIIDYPNTDLDSKELNDFQTSMLQQIDNLSDDIQGINK